MNLTTRIRNAEGKHFSIAKAEMTQCVYKYPKLLIGNIHILYVRGGFQTVRFNGVDR